MNPADDPARRKPLRLWPGVAAAVALLLGRYVYPLVVPAAGGTAILLGLAGALGVLAWWLFFSRAPWAERIGTIVVMVIALLATSRVVHQSISNGFMGMLLPLFAVPLCALALVAAVVAGRHLSRGTRRVLIAAAILLASASMTLVRTGGVTGSGESELHWRWTVTPEERLLAKGVDGLTATSHESPAPLPVPEAAPPATANPRTGEPPNVSAKTNKMTPSATSPGIVAGKRASAATDVLRAARSADPGDPRTRAEWPGFRGPRRDGVVRGVSIDTDWAAHPPVELWRRPIGPGWSSFAVSGDLVYTQEQRGEDELVSGYRLSTGEPVWMHRDRVRFWESNGGAGPRGTPTLHDGRVYTFGATGIVNALDARTGRRVWTRNAAVDTGKAIPDWGFASSPLVVNDLVVVAAAGQLAAYDVRTGNPRWIGEPGGGGYSSPHFASIAGVDQVLLFRGARTIAVAPGDGTLLWEHTWQPAVSIVQPVLVGDGNVLVAAGDSMGGMGIRRIAVARGSGGWTVEERWTSRGLKPYFNDFVVHGGHAFGFDASILACIDLADGTRKWKGGRYGHGQLVLLPDQDVLLVLSEDGELALVRATPGQYTEIARLPALDGKSWNHPVLVGDVLLVRNGEEMAAFRLALSR
ncbi:MAG: PQQ-binding-like beta-propeller repeat protein [Vicinamibacterales bacterium]